MTVTPLGWDQDCSLKIQEPEVPAPWFLDPGGWSKTAAVNLYFIFPGICTLSLEFKNFFACMMNDIILEIYDLPKSYLACTLLAFTLIIHTAFKYWLTNKKKDESLLGLMHKKILSLESANQDLQNRLLNLESANLMQELQSINNKCIAKIGFVDNKYEYLMDRTLTLQSEVVTTQTQCKEERLSLIDKIRSLESCVSEEHNRWYDSMKNLESQAREEVHSLEQTLCARLQALEEILCKHDKESNKQKGKTIKVITSPNDSNPMAYPVIIHERPADDTHPEPYATHTLQPISIRDFKNMKEAIVTYGIHSTYVKQMLNSWSTSNRIIPDDWHQLTSAVLEYSQQLQWKSWLREEARNLEQQGKLRGFEISQDQILGEGHFADRNIQATYDEHTISLCRTAALNAWEKIPEPGKQTEVYTKIFQGPREPFTDFLQRLTTAIKKAVSDTELRKLLTETLAFNNANTECKRILTPLKVRLAPLEEWIQYTNDIETFNDGNEAWIGETIPRGGRRPRGTKCFKCGTPGHISRNCTWGAPRSNTHSRTNPNRRPQPSGLCRRCGKGRHWTNECRSVIDIRGNALPAGNTSGGLVQAPKSKVVQTFPVTVEEIPLQDN
ncbi:hypothetical protein STEG23_017586 [Scotinomys teguina]